MLKYYYVGSPTSRLRVTGRPGGEYSTAPLAAALTDALGAAGRIQPEMLIGSNFGLVATVNKKTIVKAPDWFYVPQGQYALQQADAQGRVLAAKLRELGVDPQSL